MPISNTYQPSAPTAKSGQGSAVSNREDLSNELAILAPEETPLLSLARRARHPRPTLSGPWIASPLL